MTNTVGFKGFRPTEEITEEALAAALARLSTSNLYVYWVGETYKLRNASLRSNSLRTISEVKVPVPVETLITRAARISGSNGYNPATVKSGLYLHRNSKPAVYFALERKDDGSLVAATDIPYALGYANGLKRGDLVIPADAKEARELTKALAAAKKAAKVEAPPAPVKAEAPKLSTSVRKGRKAIAAATA